MNKQMGGQLYKHLRCKKKCRKHYGGDDRRGQLPNRVSIEQQMEIVQQRQRIGDWEVDTIIGKRYYQVIVTFVEITKGITAVYSAQART
jgi:IS30 family transposase